MQKIFLCICNRSSIQTVARPLYVYLTSKRTRYDWRSGLKPAVVREEPARAPSYLHIIENLFAQHRDVHLPVVGKHERRLMDEQEHGYVEGGDGSRCDPTPQRVEHQVRVFDSRYCPHVEREKRCEDVATDKECPILVSQKQARVPVVP